MPAQPECQSLGPIVVRLERELRSLLSQDGVGEIDSEIGVELFCGLENVWKKDQRVTDRYINSMANRVSAAQADLWDYGDHVALVGFDICASGKQSLRVYYGIGRIIDHGLPCEYGSLPHVSKTELEASENRETPIVPVIQYLSLIHI